MTEHVHPNHDRPQVVCTCSAAKGSKDATALIDTGADRSAMSRRLLKAIGAPVVGECGVETSYMRHTAELYRVKIAPITADGTRTVTVDVVNMNESAARVDLILGLDVLKWFRFEFDPSRGHCKLALSRGEPSAAVVTCHCQATVDVRDAWQVLSWGAQHPVCCSPKCVRDWLCLYEQLLEKVEADRATEASKKRRRRARIAGRAPDTE